MNAMTEHIIVDTGAISRRLIIIIIIIIIINIATLTAFNCSPWVSVDQSHTFCTQTGDLGQQCQQRIPDTFGSCPPPSPLHDPCYRNPRTRQRDTYVSVWGEGEGGEGRNEQDEKHAGSFSVIQLKLLNVQQEYI